MKLLYLALLVCTIGALHAGSVRLINNSPYKLRAVIRGSDGTYLGEVIIVPNHSTTWTDSYGQQGYAGHGTAYQQGATRSQTPYTVLWHCMEGKDYSICSTVPTGGTVSAQGCEGSRQCGPEVKTPPNATEEHLTPSTGTRG